MKISFLHSHLNGLEYLIVHNPVLWEEIQRIVEDVRVGESLFGVPPAQASIELQKRFTERGWRNSIEEYWAAWNARPISRVARVSLAEQKTAFESTDWTPAPTYTQSDYIKERVAVGVWLGEQAERGLDLFVKHLAFYIGDVIDVGVEIVPMKELQAEMSSGPAYYEGELYNLIREGRGVPAVPLVLVGVAP